MRWRCYWFFIYVIVFFFKQKTAYEMRISDWSSDVCSSDLPQPGQRVIELAVEIVRRRPQRGGVDRQHRPAEPGHRRVIDHHRVAEARQRLLRQPGLRDIVAPSRRHEGMVRSEEHTSELQSLMRI